MMAQLELNREVLSKLRGLREDLSTNRGLAKEMEVDEGSLSRLLAGKCGLGPSTLAGLVKAFGVAWLPDLLIVVDDNDTTAA